MYIKTNTLQKSKPAAAKPQGRFKQIFTQPQTVLAKPAFQRKPTRFSASKPQPNSFVPLLKRAIIPLAKSVIGWAKEGQPVKPKPIRGWARYRQAVPDFPRKYNNRRPPVIFKSATPPPPFNISVKSQAMPYALRSVSSNYIPSQAGKTCNCGNPNCNSSISFVLNSAQLTPNQRVAIDALAQKIISQKIPFVIISGHADASGFDINLAYKRAEKIRNALMNSMYAIRPNATHKVFWKTKTRRYAVSNKKVDVCLSRTP
jgi:outer membrane protein OmpA-like peptidoglycan-associated protein